MDTHRSPKSSVSSVTTPPAHSKRIPFFRKVTAPPCHPPPPPPPLACCTLPALTLPGRAGGDTPPGAGGVPLPPPTPALAATACPHPAAWP